MENGSGGFMSDLTFNGGKFGMWVGNQQFLSRNLVFNDCDTAIYMNWVSDITRACIIYICIAHYIFKSISISRNNKMHFMFPELAMDL